jgi:hypothetical protein
MKLKHLLPYVWKLPVCGLAFYLGTILVAASPPASGLSTPALPEGTDAATRRLDREGAKREAPFRAFRVISRVS